MIAIQWLNDLPLWAASIVLVGGAIALAIGGTAVARTFFGEEALALNNIVGGFEYLFVSMVYAGFLGFLLYGVYQRYDQVRAVVTTETSDLTTLDRVAEVFPVDTRNQLRAALKEYARHVAEVEWPQMRNRNANVLTTAALDDLAYIYDSVEPSTRKQLEVLNYSKELIGRMRDQRGIRVLRSLGGLPILLWMVTMTATAVSIVFPWFFGSPNANATILMAILSIILTTSVVLVVLKLGYPFSGSSGIQPTAYLAFVQELSARGG